MLDRLQEDSTIQHETDSLGGFGPLETGLYDMTIKYAYYTESKGGAIALNIDAEGPNKEQYREQLWVASGTAKGGKNFYINKQTKEKTYLPGFVIANSIALLGARKKIGELPTEDKTIMLYDNTEGVKKEVPTKVKMVMELIGKTVTLGIQKSTIDKTALNDATNEYEATGDTRDINEIVKVFRASDGKTVAEIIAGTETGEFKQKWADKWTGQTRMKAKGTGVTAGAPAKAATPAVAPTEVLFG